MQKCEKLPSTMHFEKVSEHRPACIMSWSEPLEGPRWHSLRIAILMSMLDLQEIRRNISVSAVAVYCINTSSAVTVQRPNRFFQTWAQEPRRLQTQSNCPGYWAQQQRWSRFVISQTLNLPTIRKVSTPVST